MTHRRRWILFTVPVVALGFVVIQYVRGGARPLSGALPRNVAVDIVDLCDVVDNAIASATDLESEAKKNEDNLLDITERRFCEDLASWWCDHGVLVDPTADVAIVKDAMRTALRARGATSKYMQLFERWIAGTNAIDRRLPTLMEQDLDRREEYSRWFKDALKSAKGEAVWEGAVATVGKRLARLAKQTADWLGVTGPVRHLARLQDDARKTFEEGTTRDKDKRPLVNVITGLASNLERVFVAGSSGDVLVLDAKDGSVLSSHFGRCPESSTAKTGGDWRGHVGAVRSITLLAGDLVATGGEDGMIAIWKLHKEPGKAPNLVASFRPGGGTVVQIAGSRSGGWLAAATSSGLFVYRVYRPGEMQSRWRDPVRFETGAVARAFALRASEQAADLAYFDRRYDPKKKELFSAIRYRRVLANREVKVIDDLRIRLHSREAREPGVNAVKSGAAGSRRPSLVAPVTSLAFGPHGGLVAGLSDGHVVVWRQKGLQLTQLAPQRIHQGSVTVVRHTGDFVLSASHDNTARLSLGEAAPGDSTRLWNESDDHGWVLSASSHVSAWGHTVVTGAANGRVTCHEIKHGKPPAKLWVVDTAKPEGPKIARRLVKCMRSRDAAMRGYVEEVATHLESCLGLTTSEADIGRRLRRVIEPLRKGAERALSLASAADGGSKVLSLPVGKGGSRATVGRLSWEFRLLAEARAREAAAAGPLGLRPCNVCFENCEPKVTRLADIAVRGLLARSQSSDQSIVEEIDLGIAHLEATVEAAEVPGRLPHFVADSGFLTVRLPELNRQLRALDLAPWLRAAHASAERLSGQHGTGYRLLCEVCAPPVLGANTIVGRAKLDLVTKTSIADLRGFATRLEDAAIEHLQTVLRNRSKALDDLPCLAGLGRSTFPVLRSVRVVSKYPFRLEVRASAAGIVPLPVTIQVGLGAGGVFEPRSVTADTSLLEKVLPLEIALRYAPKAVYRLSRAVRGRTAQQVQRFADRKEESVKQLHAAVRSIVKTGIIAARLRLGTTLIAAPTNKIEALLAASDPADNSASEQAVRELTAQLRRDVATTAARRLLGQLQNRIRSIDERPLSQLGKASRAEIQKAIRAARTKIKRAWVEAVIAAACKTRADWEEADIKREIKTSPGWNEIVKLLQGTLETALGDTEFAANVALAISDAAKTALEAEACGVDALRTDKELGNALEHCVARELGRFTCLADPKKMTVHTQLTASVVALALQELATETVPALRTLTTTAKKGIDEFLKTESKKLLTSLRQGFDPSLASLWQSESSLIRKILLDGKRTLENSLGSLDAPATMRPLIRRFEDCIATARETAGLREYIRDAAERSVRKAALQGKAKRAVEAFETARRREIEAGRKASEALEALGKRLQGTARQLKQAVPKLDGLRVVDPKIVLADGAALHGRLLPACPGAEELAGLAAPVELAIRDSATQLSDELRKPIDRLAGVAAAVDRLAGFGKEVSRELAGMQNQVADKINERACQSLAGLGDLGALRKQANGAIKEGIDELARVDSKLRSRWHDAESRVGSWLRAHGYLLEEGPRLLDRTSHATSDRFRTFVEDNSSLAGELEKRLGAEWSTLLVQPALQAWQRLAGIKAAIIRHVEAGSRDLTRLRHEASASFVKLTSEFDRAVRVPAQRLERTASALGRLAEKSSLRELLSVQEALAEMKDDVDLSRKVLDVDIKDLAEKLESILVNRLKPLLKQTGRKAIKKLAGDVADICDPDEVKNLARQLLPNAVVVIESGMLVLRVAGQTPISIPLSQLSDPKRVQATILAQLEKFGREKVKKLADTAMSEAERKIRSWLAALPRGKVLHAQILGVPCTVSLVRDGNGLRLEGRVQGDGLVPEFRIVSGLDLAVDQKSKQPQVQFVYHELRTAPSLHDVIGTMIHKLVPAARIGAVRVKGSKLAVHVSYQIDGLPVSAAGDLRFDLRAKGVETKLEFKESLFAFIRQELQSAINGIRELPELGPIELRGANPVHLLEVPRHRLGVKLELRVSMPGMGKVDLDISIIPGRGIVIDPPKLPSLSKIAGHVVNGLLKGVTGSELVTLDDAPWYRVEGGLALFLRVTVPIKPLDTEITASVAVGVHGMRLRSALRVQLPGWHNVPPYSFGRLEIAIDPQRRIVKAGASITLSPGEAWSWLIRADGNSEIDLARLRLTQRGRLVLAGLLTLAETRTVLDFKALTFESTMATSKKLKWLLEAEGKVRIQLRNDPLILLAAKGGLFGVRILEAELSLNRDLSGGLAGKIDLSFIGSVKAKASFQKGFSRPELAMQLDLGDLGGFSIVEVGVHATLKRAHIQARAAIVSAELVLPSLGEFDPAQILTALLANLLPSFDVPTKFPDGLSFGGKGDEGSGDLSEPPAGAKIVTQAPKKSAVSQATQAALPKAVGFQPWRKAAFERVVYREVKKKKLIVFTETEYEPVREHHYDDAAAAIFASYKTPAELFALGTIYKVFQGAGIALAKHRSVELALFQRQGSGWSLCWTGRCTRADIDPVSVFRSGEFALFQVGRNFVAARRGADLTQGGSNELVQISKAGSMQQFYQALVTYKAAMAKDNHADPTSLTAAELHAGLRFQGHPGIHESKVLAGGMLLVKIDHGGQVEQFLITGDRVFSMTGVDVNSTFPHPKQLATIHMGRTWSDLPVLGHIIACKGGHALVLGLAKKDGEPHPFACLSATDKVPAIEGQWFVPRFGAPDFQSHRLRLRNALAASKSLWQLAQTETLIEKLSSGACKDPVLCYAPGASMGSAAGRLGFRWTNAAGDVELGIADPKLPATKTETWEALRARLATRRALAPPDTTVLEDPAIFLEHVVHSKWRTLGWSANPAGLFIK